MISVNNFQNLDFCQNFRTISISVNNLKISISIKFSKNFDWLKNLDLCQNSKKNSMLVKHFENHDFDSIRNISISAKNFENIVSGQDFRKKFDFGWKFVKFRSESIFLKNFDPGQKI